MMISNMLKSVKDRDVEPNTKPEDLVDVLHVHRLFFCILFLVNILILCVMPEATTTYLL